MGAVSTTTIAGCPRHPTGLAKPIGSLTQMGTVRLGKRTEGRSPLIKDFVPLASLDSIVFGGWDIFDENAYEAAKTAGVLEKDLLDQIRPELEQIAPMSAVFDRRYVKRLDGPNVKKGKNKMEISPISLREDMRRFKSDNGLRSARHGVVRQHRGVPDRSRPCTRPSRRSKRASKRATTRSPRA